MIALQLYTLRDALKADFDGSMKRVAAMGFSSVETAGEYGGSSSHAAQVFDDLGITVCSAHMSLLEADDLHRSLDEASILRVGTVVCPWIPPDRFTSLDSVKAVCERLNEANMLVQAQGLRMAYHNHHFELEAMPDGRLPLDIMAELLEETIVFEVDTYWAQTAGADAGTLLKKLDQRAPLLHIKDGPLKLDAPMVAVGDGSMDFASILEGNEAEWWIVEMDHCASDSFIAVERSLKYLNNIAQDRS